MSGRSPSLWSQLPQSCPAPGDRHRHACCPHGGHVYVLGGRGRHALRDFWKYNVACNEWTELDCSGPAAPEELEEHSMVAWQGFLYVFGGRIDSAYSDWKTSLWVFDIGKERWVTWHGDSSPQRQVPTNRKAHSAVVFGSAMFVYGGLIDMRGSSQEFWRLDFDTMLWSVLENIPGGPGPRHSHSAVTHLDSMYLFGGLRGLREQRDLWRWSSTSHAWTSLRTTSGPCRLLGHAAVTYRDSMLLFGGGESLGSPRNCLWRYSFTSHAWDKMAVLPGCSTPPSRIHHCCVGLGPSYQPRTSTTSTTTTSTSSTTTSTPAILHPAHSHRSSSKLRPFKNKCFPASSSPEAEGAIELQTFSAVKGRELVEPGDFVQGFGGFGARNVELSLTFENQSFVNKEWDSAEEEEEEEEEEGGGQEEREEENNISHHLPDLLLVLGGKPLVGGAAISVWQMTLSDL